VSCIHPHWSTEESGSRYCTLCGRYAVPDTQATGHTQIKDDCTGKEYKATEQKDEPIGSHRDENSEFYQAKCAILVTDFIDRKILTGVDGGLRRAVKWMAIEFAKSQEELAQARQRIEELYSELNDSQAAMLRNQERIKELEGENRRLRKGWDDEALGKDGGGK
jgi:hypothetical protein